jgi:hypothetical protein
MSAKEARATVFGNIDDLHETNGRVDAKMPEHELRLIRERFPDIPMSDLARLGLNVAAQTIPAGMTEAEALKTVTRKRGPKPKELIST